MAAAVVSKSGSPATKKGMNAPLQTSPGLLSSLESSGLLAQETARCW